MFDNALQDWTKRFLENLKSDNLPYKTYLGGGTAIALQLGHRRSADLDFFTPTKFAEIRWQQELEESFRFKLLQKDEQTLIGTVGKVKLSLLGYRYKLIGETERYKRILLASLPDLAAMKLDTIIARGAKRDFIDVYFLAQKYGLQKLLAYYRQKYGNFQGRELMIEKGLLFFEDADKQYMPDMLVPADWKKIKSWFVDQVKRL